jgi:hypothetical protein
MRRFAALMVLGMVSWTVAAESGATLTKAKNGEPLSAKGKPKTDSFTDKAARFFVWNDDDGWHLRTASHNGVAKFEGTIESSDGQFGKLRPIGLESKGKAADAWQADAARKKIEFRIHTGGSFDGFDFSLPRNDPGTLTFTLKIAEKERPGRVFVGREMQTPAELPLVLPGAP